MANELKIQTPEGVVFSLQLGGPVARMLAWTVDVMIMIILITLVAQVISVTGWLSMDFSRGLMTVASFAISIGYSILAEWLWRGQTPGKRVLRLRVIDEQGLKLQFSQVVVRNLLRIVDALPFFYLVGGLACVVNGRRQRLGDIAAGTIVVREPRRSEPDLDQLGPAKYNSLKNHPHLVARLRQRVTPEQGRVALQALLRRESFEPEARVQLFSELALYFRELVLFPPEAVEGVADEQYVRNVVEVLFRRADTQGAKPVQKA